MTAPYYSKAGTAEQGADTGVALSACTSEIRVVARWLNAARGIHSHNAAKVLTVYAVNMNARVNIDLGLISSTYTSVRALKCT